MRLSAEQVSDIAGSRMTICPSATCCARRCRRTEARKTAPRPNLMKLFKLLSQG